MLVDMHLHECTYSLDSKISLEEIVTTARGRGWTLSASRTMTAWDSGNMRQSIQTGPVFPILWVLSSFPFRGYHGVGIEDYPGCRVDAQDFINHVNEAGGFLCLLPPFPEQ